MSAATVGLAVATSDGRPLLRTGAYFDVSGIPCMQTLPGAAGGAVATIVQRVEDTDDTAVATSSGTGNAESDLEVAAATVVFAVLGSLSKAVAISTDASFVDADGAETAPTLTSQARARGVLRLSHAAPRRGPWRQRKGLNNRLA